MQLISRCLNKWPIMLVKRGFHYLACKKLLVRKCKHEPFYSVCTSSFGCFSDEDICTNHFTDTAHSRVIKVVKKKVLATQRQRAERTGTIVLTDGLIALQNITYMGSGTSFCSSQIKEYVCGAPMHSVSIARVKSHQSAPAAILLSLRDLSSS